ncbi:MAG: endolytic transglycosylase MltG [Candidatus Wildermuthbacteria bacterium]|nr:endolytic transglycosylase MltG [Candidatus Wildermuthbacteria bacterium]
MVSFHMIGKRLLLFLLLCIAIAVLFLPFLWLAITTPAHANSSRVILFQIEKGQSIKTIARNLKDAGLIRSEWAFYLYTISSRDAWSIQRGSYELSPSLPIPRIVEIITSAKETTQRITIREGWNLRDIAEYLAEKQHISTDQVFQILRYPAAHFTLDFELLRDKPASASLEGYLFPDTYEIYRSEGIENIAQRMLGNFEIKFNQEMRAQVQKQNKSIFEIVTVASLIEKEVQIKEDKEIVAGIIWKRLANDIPLQIDATISYITGKRSTKISLEETQIDSPYNTYTYLGLPAGPIANPGLDSIQAALYPKETPYWYYLSTSDGITIFSRTLEQHNIAKAKYLK